MVVGLLLLVPIAVSPISTGASGAAFAEDWEYPPPREWELTMGVGIDTDCAALGTGCHVKADPPCCPGYHTQYREYVDIALDARTEIEFLFQGSGLGGHHDTLFQAAFDVGWVNLELTGGSGNNRVEAYTSDGIRRAAGSWTSTNTWHTIRAVLDPVNGTVHVELRTQSGSLLAASATAPLPADATRIADVSIQSVRWGSDSVVYRFDNVAIRSGSALMLRETWDPEIPGWTTRGIPAIDCGLGRPGCSLRLSPDASNDATVERDVDVPRARFTTIEFWYRWDGVGTSADSVAQVRLDRGSFNVEMTGGGDNNRAELFVPGLPKVPIGVIPAEQWVKVYADIDTLLHVVTVEIYREDGTHIGGSLPLPLSLSASRVSGLQFHANDWGSSALSFRYDTVRITTTSG